MELGEAFDGYKASLDSISTAGFRGKWREKSELVEKIRVLAHCQLSGDPRQSSELMTAILDVTAKVDRASSGKCKDLIAKAASVYESIHSDQEKTSFTDVFLKSRTQKENFKKMLKLHEKLSVGMTEDYSERLARAISNFRKPVTERLKSLKELSANMGSFDKVYLAEAICAMEKPVTERLKSLKGLSANMDNSGIRNLAVSIAEMKNPVKEKLQLLKKYSGGMKTREKLELAQTINVFNEPVQKRYKAFLELSNEFSHYQKNDFAEAIGGLPEPLKVSLGAYKQLSKNMNSEKKLKLAKALSGFHEPVELRLEVLKKYSKDLDPEQALRLARIIKIVNEPIESNLNLFNELSKGLRLEEVQAPLANLLNNFEAIEGEDLPSSKERFKTMLRENLLINADAQGFLSSCFYSSGEHFSNDDPLVKMGRILHRDRPNSHSRGDSVGLDVLRSEVEKSPVDHLRLLIDGCASNEEDLRNLSLFIRFVKEDLSDYEIGSDAGGLSREYLSLLFQNLCRDLDLHSSLATQGKEEDLENLGKLFMACFHSDTRPEEKYSQKLILGEQLPVGYFSAIQSLKAENIQQEEDEVPIETKAKVINHVIKAWQESNPSVGTYAHNIFLSKSKEDIQESDKEKIIEELNVMLLTREAEDFKSIKDDWGKSVKFLIDAHYPRTFSTVQSIAKGMLPLVSRSEDDRELFWDELFAKVSSEKLSHSIQGKMDRGHLAEAVLYSGTNPVVQQKMEWLQAWIRDESTSKEKINKFISTLSGASGLPPGQDIKIEELSSGGGVFHFHTCAFQLDVNPEFIEVELGGDSKKLPSSRKEKERFQKEAFLQQFEKEIEDTQTFTDA